MAYHDAGEVDVGHDHDVELAEQRELVQRARRLAVRLAGLPQVLDAPHDGEQDRTAADDVHLSSEQGPQLDSMAGDTWHL